MPVSTEPFEVMFEFTNDATDCTTLQLTREDAATTVSNSQSGTTSTGRAGGGPMIRLFPKDSVSLVLNAGATYHYLVKQSNRKAQISIRTWRDTKCTTSDVLSGTVTSGEGLLNEGAQRRATPWTPLSQDVTVVCLPAPTTTSSSSAWAD